LKKLSIFFGIFTESKY